MKAAETVHSDLARFAAALNDAYDKVCEGTPPEFFDTFGPISLEVRTVDGLTLRFWEEGIEFYPETEAALAEQESETSYPCLHPLVGPEARHLTHRCDYARRTRPERQAWVRAVLDEDADGRPGPGFIFDRSYLDAHPERAIAEVQIYPRGARAFCDACGWFATPTAFLSGSEVESEEHNKKFHPRRARRLYEGESA